MEDTFRNLALPDLACLRLSGFDAGSFLQSQLSVDVLQLENGQSRLGAYCNIKGRVLTTLVVARLGEGYLLLVPKALLQPLETTLRRYQLRAKVNFSRHTELAGSNDSEGNIAHPLDKQRFFRLEAGVIDNSDRHAWALADIQAGMVWLDTRTSLKHLPQSLGLTEMRGLDFNKGCYPGQEIVARLHYLGQSKYGLYRVSGPSVTEPDIIRNMDDRKQGQWLNFVRTGKHCHGLAVLSAGPVEQGQELYTETAASPTPRPLEIKPLVATTAG